VLRISGVAPVTDFDPGPLQAHESVQKKHDPTEISMSRTLLVAAFLAAGVGAARAEGSFYYGFGLGATRAESESNFPGVESDDTFGLLGLTFGYRRERASGFMALELDGDLSFGNNFTGDSGTECDTYADGPYFCTHDATLRLRAVAGQVMNNGMEGFVSLGFAAVRGESAVQPTVQENNTNIGFTLGLGAQKNLASGRRVRGEAVLDVLHNSTTEPRGWTPEYEAVTLKATFLY
jgi:opacity protein-like surface antigen